MRAMDLKLSISRSSTDVVTPNSRSSCTSSSTNASESSTPMPYRSVSAAGTSTLRTSENTLAIRSRSVMSSTMSAFPVFGPLRQPARAERQPFGVSGGASFIALEPFADGTPVYLPARVLRKTAEHHPAGRQHVLGDEGVDRLPKMRRHELLTLERHVGAADEGALELARRDPHDGDLL